MAIIVFQVVSSSAFKTGRQHFLVVVTIASVRSAVLKTQPETTAFGIKPGIVHNHIVFCSSRLVSKSAGWHRKVGDVPLVYHYLIEKFN